MSWQVAFCIVDLLSRASLLYTFYRGFVSSTRGLMRGRCFIPKRSVKPDREQVSSQARHWKQTKIYKSCLLTHVFVIQSREPTQTKLINRWNCAHKATGEWIFLHALALTYDGGGQPSSFYPSLNANDTQPTPLCNRKCKRTPKQVLCECRQCLSTTPCAAAAFQLMFTWVAVKRSRKS